MNNDIERKTRSLNELTDWRKYLEKIDAKQNFEGVSTESSVDFAQDIFSRFHTM